MCVCVICRNRGNFVEKFPSNSSFNETFKLSYLLQFQLFLTYLSCTLPPLSSYVIFNFLLYLNESDLTTRRVLENAGAVDRALAVDAGDTSEPVNPFGDIFFNTI